MRGSCFVLCTPVHSSRLPLTHTAYSHTTLSHTTLTHNSLTHNSYTQLTHAQLNHTHSLLTHNSITHGLLTHNSLTHSSLTHNSHTQLTHTQHHTTLSHTPCSHTSLSQTAFSHKTHSHTARLSHTTCSHTANLLTRAQLLCGRRGTWRHRPSLCVATYGTGLALVARLMVAAAVCVAGVALGDIQCHLATLSHTFDALTHNFVTYNSEFFHLLLFPTILPAHALSLSCLSYLIFTSAW